MASTAAPGGDAPQPLVPARSGSAAGAASGGSAAAFGTGLLAALAGLLWLVRPRAQSNDNQTTQKAGQIGVQQQTVGQSCGCADPPPGWATQELVQEQEVTNRTHQKNRAFALSPTLLSGDNVQLGLIDKGDQLAWAGTWQSQSNGNVTKQSAFQAAFQEQFVR